LTKWILHCSVVRSGTLSVPVSWKPEITPFNCQIISDERKKKISIPLLLQEASRWRGLCGGIRPCSLVLSCCCCSRIRDKRPWEPAMWNSWMIPARMKCKWRYYWESRPTPDESGSRR
jgi:hypothetical protein